MDTRDDRHTVAPAGEAASHSAKRTISQLHTEFEGETSMKFYAALSVSRGQIRQVGSRLLNQYGTTDPIGNIIFTPIATGQTSHEAIHDLADKLDISLMYDSGGYEVQTGDLEFDDLLGYLHEYYGTHTGANRYVLPDNVPMTDDSADTVHKKVKETISASRTCYKRAPPIVRERAVGVVQGHTRDDLSRCLDAYADLGLETVAFGSFGTGGKNGSVNMITSEALKNLKWTVNKAHSEGIEVHALGVGGPTSIPLLAQAGVDSFDSSAWMRSSGYGNVFFPFKSRYNASHRTVRSGKVLRASELVDLKRESGHDCPYCSSIDKLRDSRWNRIMHNLIVTYEMATATEEMERDEMLSAMDSSSIYRSRLEAM